VVAAQIVSSRNFLLDDFGKETRFPAFWLIYGQLKCVTAKVEYVGWSF